MPMASSGHISHSIVTSASINGIGQTIIMHSDFIVSSPGADSSSTIATIGLNNVIGIF